MALDIAWEDPGLALFLRSLASFSRVILFNRRGSSTSTRCRDPLPSWESYAVELDAVLDAVGSQQTAILAELDARGDLLRRHQTRTHQRPHSRTHFGQIRGQPRLPDRGSAQGQEALLAQFDQLWGTDAMADDVRPSRAGDAGFLAGGSQMQRTSVGHEAAQPYVRAMLEVDVRPILPLVQAPTLILHRRDVQSLPVEQGATWPSTFPRRGWSSCPGPTRRSSGRRRARPGPDPAVPDRRPSDAEPARVLATVLFTDIVASTERASRLGPALAELLNTHDELARRLVEEFGGRLVKTTGDGLLATFDGPGRADPLRGRPRGRAGRHRRPAPGGAAPARSSCATVTSAASPCTSRLG